MPTSTNLYFFVSLDVIDSTAFKVNDPSGWPSKIKAFYRLAREHIVRPSNWQTEMFVYRSNDPIMARPVQPGIAGAHLWKHVGDEVLFWKHISTRDDLERAMRGAFASMGAIESSLSEIYPSLHAKMSCWVALAGIDEGRNIIVSTADDGSLIPPFIDFLGPTIDEGFRMAKYAEKHVITINPELAWLLGELPGDAVHQAKVVGLKRLKGVWRNDYFPIIWYTENWQELLEERYGGYQDRLDHPVLAEIDRYLERSTLNRTLPIERIVRDRNMEASFKDLLAAYVS